MFRYLTLSDIKTFNIDTKEIKEFSSIVDAAKYHKTFIHTVKRLININKAKPLGICNKIIYKRYDDLREFANAVNIRFHRK